MENPIPAAYDYRAYDRIWQRVSPDLNPYPDIRAAAEEPASPPVPAPVQEGGATLPGAEPDPCCMGTEARESLEVLEGFLEEELAGRRCCLALACRFRNQNAVRLLRRIAREKQAAARELATAYYLITGSCYAPAAAVENAQWASLAEGLRSCYHQEACNGFNYQRAADAALDPCLQRMLNRLGEQSYRRADEIMALLGQMIC